MFSRIVTASMLLAGALITAGVTKSEAVTMRTVVCSNGKTVQAPDSQSSKRACALASKRAPIARRTLAVTPAFSAAAGGQSAAGNPCAPGKSTKGCRDWINGNKKPPIRDKK